MKKIEFYKLQASGNDFILLDNSKPKMKLDKAFYRRFAKKYCSRGVGIGADGVLAIEPSNKADFKMRVFNADGTEAEMCGNGARCLGLWANQAKKKKDIKFETKAGIIEAKVEDKGKAFLASPGRKNHRLSSMEFSNRVKIKMSAPFGSKMDLPLTILGRKIKVNFINTGVPHAIIFVEGLEKIDVNRIGRKVRMHRQFEPAGTNVDFVELKNNNSLAIRTYERGVEAETLACGTGAVASALISRIKLNSGYKKKTISFSVKTKSGDVLKVTFDNGKKISNVWLQGEAHLIYKGEAVI